MAGILHFLQFGAFFSDQRYAVVFIIIFFIYLLPDLFCVVKVIIYMAYSHGIIFIPYETTDYFR